MLACAVGWAWGVAYKDTDRRRVDTLQAPDIDSLGVITEPVTKVCPLDEHRSPLFAVQESNALQHILDVYVSLTYCWQRGCERSRLPP